MSIALQLLNAWLRRVEKRRMRDASAVQLRRSLAVQSRLLFHPPRGTRFERTVLGGVSCLQITPRNFAAGRVILYVHGGGFVFGSPQTHSAMAAQLALRCGAQVILPRYRLAPEAPFPAAPDDIRAVWEGLLASGVAPRDVVVGGDSAGGALAFGLIAVLCAHRHACPGAVFGLSPLTDLTFSGDSFHGNAQRDVLLVASRAAELTEQFLRGHPKDDPCVSPHFGDFTCAPPAWVTVGDTEILLDDSRRLVARLLRAGSQATLVERHDHPHVWPLFHNTLPEARSTLDELAQWIRQQQSWAI
jgi:acetyl esterase/lipase